MKITLLLCALVVWVLSGCGGDGGGSSDHSLTDAAFNVLWVVPALFAIAALKLLCSAGIARLKGERVVGAVLNRLGEDVLHDIILPDGQGGLTQIDHVVLTRVGLLVIETTHYQGRILGKRRDSTWTQCLGRRRFRFQNPLHQNYLHTQALKALVPGIPIVGRVVFSGAAKFPKGLPEGVSMLKTLKGDLRPLFAETPVAAERLSHAWERLQAAARTDGAARQAHLKGIHARYGSDRRVPVALGLLIALGVSVLAMLMQG